MYVYTPWQQDHRMQLIMDESTHTHVHAHTHTHWSSKEGHTSPHRNSVSHVSHRLCLQQAHCALLCLPSSISLRLSRAQLWNFPSKQLVNDGAPSCIFKHLTGIFHCAVSAQCSHKSHTLKPLFLYLMFPFFDKSQQCSYFVFTLQ